jgi:hypothetical protein
LISLCHDGAGRRLVVVGDDLVEAGELPGVHVRRAPGDIPQRGNLERPFERLPFRHQELQFGALGAGCVAPAAAAIEFVRENVLRTGGPAAIGLGGRRRGDAGIVEFVIGEERTVVALRAVRLADEETQAGDLVTPAHVRGRLSVRGERLHVAVEPRRAEL